MFTELSPELEAKTTYLKTGDWFYRVTAQISPLLASNLDIKGGTGLYLVEAFRKQGLTIENKFGLNHYLLHAYIGPHSFKSFIDKADYELARQTMVDKIIDFQIKRIDNPNV